MPLAKYIELEGVPIRGGAVTAIEKGLLKPGQFSMVQNLRPKHPGFEKRKGQRVLHTTADSTNQAITAYQFKKTRESENKTFVQMSDGDVLELTANPPTVTAGVMGAEAFDGATAPKPASWGNLGDTMLFSAGVDQHKLYPGALTPVGKFVVVYGTADPTGVKGVVELGMDYSEEMSDGQSTTVAILDSLDTAANGDGFYVCTPVPAKSLTVTVSAANGTVSTLTGYYWKNDSTWASASITDNTKTGGNTTLGQSGTITWTPPTDIQDKYLFGRVGYWYLFVVSVALDAEVEISSVTFDAPWASLENLWDGVQVLSPIVLVEGTTQFKTYSGSSVDLDALAISKKIYVYSLDPLEGIYINPAGTPNATGTSLTSAKYWDGDSWASLTAQDGTSGMSNAGWITFNRQSDVQPLHMESSALFGYWYELVWSAALAADTSVSIYTMPYFTIEDMGRKGLANCVWQQRALWTFADRYQEYVYITGANQPQVMNGSDFAILEVGDGRPHKIVAMKKFWNNVMIFQEEKGIEGGTITLLQGYTVPTFGKLVLSTRLGTMNAKSVEVVENVAMSTATDETIRTVAFFISRYGVGACDGRSISMISDDIQNYFDPNSTVCITRGCEAQHWLKYDPVDHVLRLGLVTGASGTVPNVFPVYDIVDGVWYFDTPAQALSFFESVDAASGNVPTVQIAGGVADGTLYQVNYGTADVSTAIDGYVRIELNGQGHYIDVLQFLLQMKAQTGDVTITTYKNGIQKDSLTLSQAAEVATQEIRRHLKSLNIVDQHVAIKIQNSSTTESLYILNVGVEARIWVNR